MQQKVCAVVLRMQDGRREILAFDHPLAGRQLVKGGIEPGETIEAAAARELFEESGLRDTVAGYLGAAPINGQEWHFALFPPVSRSDETWVHRTEDWGGVDFAFLWHPLDQLPDEGWHPIFHEALAFIRSRLAKVP
jgi:8-oxo-dGTP pyrophosphatase MutT (NUDIX family)